MILLYCGGVLTIALQVGEWICLRCGKEVRNVVW